MILMATPSGLFTPYVLPVWLRTPCVSEEIEKRHRQPQTRHRTDQVAPARCRGTSSHACRTRRPEIMTKRKIEAHEGSGNIFADLELPDADGLLLKSSIVIELHRLIKERGLTQVKAAKLLGITQPDLSHLLRGDFEDYSAERLMKMLTLFEQDIEIVMKPHRQSGVRGRITFKPAAA